MDVAHGLGEPCTLAPCGLVLNVYFFCIVYMFSKCCTVTMPFYLNSSKKDNQGNKWINNDCLREPWWWNAWTPLKVMDEYVLESL